MSKYISKQISNKVNEDKGRNGTAVHTLTTGGALRKLEIDNKQ
jgi:hypothetical protein